MPDLSFRVEGAEAVLYAAAPLLVLKLAVENANPEETIHTIALRAQIQIEATRRRYNESEKERLLDLFGDPGRWSQTLRAMLWTHASVVIPSFAGSAAADLQVPCTFDFNVAATKYFHGVSDGDIPLNLQFSGTVFYAAGERLQVAPISWDKEARFRLPVHIWREMMDAYYPNSAWLCLRRDVFDRVYQYKVRSGIPTWEEALDSLLSAAEEETGPAMNFKLVEDIANAVLYEGYMLYPYRASAVKNRQRWNFGVLYPRAYAESQRGADRWSMRTECLAVPRVGDVTLNVRVRFLHLVERTESGQHWQEAVEREVTIAPVKFRQLDSGSIRHTFAFSAGSEIDGPIQRRREPIEGAIEIEAERAGDGLFKIRAGVLNAALLECGYASRDQALMQSLVSAHVILNLQDGEFVSLLEPPDELRDIAATCQNVGAWPVLVGEAGQRDAMLASPIILYDYPQIASESAGALFDGTEIDEILTLRIMTLTDEEKREVSQGDERARRILERTESMPVEQLVKMHGAMRGLREGWTP